MRDKCCARFGQPFFRDALRSAKRGELPNTRIWKVSHIGGHRFAPTAISLPDGRYYGRLTLKALQAIVTRSGSIHQLSAVYRGWGLLPAPLQILERQLMLQYGWSWFDHAVNYQVLADNQPVSKESSSQRLRQLSVEISILPLSSPISNQSICHPKKTIGTNQTAVYQAKVVQDPQKTVCTKPSCSSAVAVPIVKYTVTECLQVDAEVVAISSVPIA